MNTRPKRFHGSYIKPAWRVVGRPPSACCKKHRANPYSATGIYCSKYRVHVRSYP